MPLKFEKYLDDFELETLQQLFRQPVFYVCLIGVVVWVSVVFGAGFSGYAALLLAILLLMLTLIDLKHMILPNMLVYPGVVLGVALAEPAFGIGWINSILGMLVGFGLFWLIHWGFYKLRGYHGMGFGDVKFLAMLGAWAGALNLPLIVLLSSVSALLFFALRRLFKGVMTSKPMPYGPFLAVGGWMALLYDTQIWMLIFTWRESLLKLLGGD